MTIKDVDIMLEKITLIEEWLDRIEQVFLKLIEDEYVTEEERTRIAEAD